MERQSTPVTSKKEQAWFDEGPSKGPSGFDTLLPPFSSLFPPVGALQPAGVSFFRKATSEQDQAITHTEITTPIVPFFYHHTGFGIESCMNVSESPQQENSL